MSADEKPPLTSGQITGLVLLFAVPLGIAVLKLPLIPTSEFFVEYASLVHLNADVQRDFLQLIAVPVGAVLITFTRLTLGFRVLGPFRSILFAVALQITGILLGLAFLILVIVILTVLQPPIRALQLPYFGHVSILLSVVAVIMVLAMLSGVWLDSEALLKTASFPVVVLCLTAHGFQRAITREGLRTALWRAAMTALVAVIVTLIVQIPGFRQFMLLFPEAFVAQMALIIIIARFMAWRRFQYLNPPAASVPKLPTQ